MKCESCGSKVTEEMIRCPKCERELWTVPDYNPLEDVLEKQMYGSMNNTSAPLDEYKINKEMGDFAETEETSLKKIARAKQMKRKRRKKKIVIGSMLFALVLLIGLSFLLYRNSYTGYVKRGYSAFARGENSKAITLFEKAIQKKGERAGAYVGLYKVYIAEEDLKTPEKILLQAVETYSDQKELYKATADFYLESDQEKKISSFLEEVEDERILEYMQEYISEAPVFSLEEETFDDVQQLTLTSDGEAIFYTLDGSEPTQASQQYEEPIQLEEGTTVVRAISVNARGISSLAIKKTYVIEIPVADAPSVVPSTGQYSQAQQIVVTVPEGYTAYYTLDGSEPTAESIHYTDPITMPEGNTIFSVVLIDAAGRASDITRRNYDLQIIYD